MSARKEDRWQGTHFTRTRGRYRLHIKKNEGWDGWTWLVYGERNPSGGVQPTEKAAKLAARRCAERLKEKDT